MLKRLLVMTTLTFIFPTGYKHGRPDYSKCYTEILFLEIPHVSNEEITQADLHQLFNKTKMKNTLDRFSFKGHIFWKETGMRQYSATPMIHIVYGEHQLDYFHNPTYAAAKFDLTLITGSKNDIPEDKLLVIPEENLMGEYIIDLNRTEPGKNE